MSDEEDFVQERRSMVGAPPSAGGGRRSSAVTPGRNARTPSARLSTRAVKRKREDESDDESVKNEADSDPETNASDDGEEPREKPKKAKKRKATKHLTDSVARKKRAEERKKAAKEARELAGIESEEEKEEKKEPSKEPTPEPVAKVPSVSKYTPFQLMCDHLLRRMQFKDPDEYFAFPVTPKMAPDYHTIITNPMDFSAIRQKIEDNTYQTIPEMKGDAELIVTNALTYNAPNSEYHLAATRLSQVVRFYFSERYLRYIFHSLPFANQVPLEKAGLTPLAPIVPRVENKRRLAVADSMTSEDCLKAADPAIRDKLATRKPAKLAFVDNKDGATVMNVIGETEKKNIRLLDIVGPLEEGNPGLLSIGDQRFSVFSLANVNMISYLSYGPFSSFAPQYDSTWATLTKRDTDLLLRTYGDKPAAHDAMSLKSMVADSSDAFIKVVDDLLSTLTDGEHERCLQQVNKKEAVEKQETLEDLLSEVESLQNLGIDVSFTANIRNAVNAPKPNDLQTELNNTGRAIVDLHRLQHQRLSAKPPVTLSKAGAPTAMETQLATNIQQQLANQISTHAQPAQVVSAPAIHSAIGLGSGVDMDILDEFFM